MKSLVCVQPGQLNYKEGAKPLSTKGRAIIKIRRIGICGTDLHAFEGTQPFFDYPRILGHELSGTLVDFDNEPGFDIGQEVTFIPYFNCGKCIACKMGKPNCCSQLKVCGVHIDGGMSEYLSVPSSSLVSGKGLTLDQLAMVEPMAIGAHGVRMAAIQKEEYVLITGAGPIGLAAMEFARISGANVIGMDINEERLRFCRENSGVGYTLNAAAPDLTEQLLTITKGSMPTVVIDATGNLNAINKGFNYIAHGGRYVLIGLQKREICFSHPEFHKKEAMLMSSRNATRSDFEFVISCIQSGTLNPLTYLSQHVLFEEAKDKFPDWLKPDSCVIKAMVKID